jgi:hypothetical protein
MLAAGVRQISLFTPNSPKGDFQKVLFLDSLVCLGNDKIIINKTNFIDETKNGIGVKIIPKITLKKVYRPKDNHPNPFLSWSQNSIEKPCYMLGFRIKCEERRWEIYFVFFK